MTRAPFSFWILALTLAMGPGPAVGKTPAKKPPAKTAAKAPAPAKAPPKNPAEEAQKLLAAGDTAKALSILTRAIEKNPQQGAVAFSLGVIFEAKKDYTGAAGYFDLAQDGKPPQANAQFRAGRAYFNASEYPTAKKRLLDWLKSAPANAEGLKMLGQCFSIEKNPKEAQVYFARAARLLSNDSLVTILYARSALEAGDLTTAVTVYAEYLIRHSGDLEARAALGRAYLSLKRVPDALAQFDQVADGNFKLIEADLDVARAYFKAGRARVAKPILLNVLRIYPENAEAQEMTATLFEKENDYGEAARHYAEALKADPSRSASLKKIADLYSKAGQDSQAVAVYETFLKSHPDPSVVGILLKTYKEQGRQEDVRRMLVILSQSKTGGAENLLALGKLDFEKGNFEAALASFSQALKLQPRHREALLLAGECRLGLKQPKLALPLLIKAFAADPKSPAAALALARAYGLSGDAQKEAVTYRKVQQLDPGNAEALDKLIAFHRASGNANALAELLNQKTKNTPGDGAAFLELGRLYLKTGRKKEAEAAFKQGAAAKNESAGASAEWGRLCFAQGRVGEAVEHYKKAVFLKSDDPDLYFELGRASLAKGDSLLAIDALEKTVERKSDHAAALKILTALYLALHEPEKAMSLLKKSSAGQPDQLPSRLGLARLFLDSKKFPEAASQLEAALRLAPQNAEACMLMGSLLQAQGKPAAAMEYFGKAWHLNPRDADAGLPYAQALHAQGNHKAALSVLQKLPATAAALALAVDCHLALGEVKIAGLALSRLEKSDPSKIQKTVSVARIYNALGKKDRALAILDSMGSSDDPEYFRLLGELALAKGQKERALEAYRTLFSKNKADLNAGLRLASLYEALGSDNDAEGVYKDLETSFPRDLSVAERLFALYKRREPQGAAGIVEALKHLMELDPNNPEYQFNKAELQAAAGKTPAAKATLNKLLKEKPGHVKANGLMGKLLANEKNAAEALPYLELAARTLKNDTALFKALGRTCVELKKFAEAAAVLERARKLDPADQETALMLALALRSLGKTASLPDLYGKILLADPRNFPARKGLGDVYYDRKEFDRAMDEYKTALSIRSDDTALLHRQATLYVNKERYAEAAVLLETLVGFDSLNGALQYQLAMLQWEHLGKTDAARSLLNRAVLSNPGLYKAFQALADIALQEEDLPAAMAALASALKLKPSDPASLKTYAGILVKQGETAKAIPILTRAVQANPGDPELKLALGKMNLAAGKTKEAVPLLAAAHALKPQDIDLTLTLVSAYNRSNQPAKSIPLLLGLIQSGFESPEVKLQLGIAYYRQGQLGMAQELLEKVLTQTQGSPEAINTLGHVYFAQGNAKKARMVYRQMLEQDPANLEANFQLGEVAMADLDYAQALQYYKVVYEKNPGYPGLAARLAECAPGQGGAQSAKMYLAEALKGNPNDPGLNFQLGQLLYREGNFPEALERFAKAKNLKGTDEPAYYYVLSLAKSGQGPEAVAAAQKMLTFYTNSARLTIALAAAYTATGEPDYALMHLQTAEKLDAGNREIFKLRAEIYGFDKNDRNSARANYQRYLFFGGDTSEVPEEYR